MIDNTHDVIDSRDVIDRIAELEADTEVDELTDDETAELVALGKLAKAGADYCADWNHGETLVRDSYFTEYAQELAEDIGAIPAGADWPVRCIDWEQAAHELQMDYTSLDFDGVTYWCR